ncbi:MAG: multidrug transporter [Clostridia bacterium]|nr:multidrug transporter [Deltaproteobacteria bacterium]
MHVGRRYPLIAIIRWTQVETLIFVGLALVPQILRALDLPVPKIPWPPVALIGTLVAFITGFKGNAAYDRLWEARQLWGGIVNTSRTWAVMAMDFFTPNTLPATHALSRRLVFRHLAWLTALRYQLREPRSWENMREVQNRAYLKSAPAAIERKTDIAKELEKYLTAEECAAVLATKNRAVQIIALQSHELSTLAERGVLSEFRHIELMRTLSKLYEHEGGCERIKAFPYPRQFATLNLMFVWLFIGILPFAVTTELATIELAVWWLEAPITVAVAWVFHTMDKVGGLSENPFEGGANDVPITEMSRTIEIDLRELIGESNVPDPLKPVNDILL